RVRGELAGDELVRLEDRQDLLDSGEALERQRREQLPLADRADHGSLPAGGDERRAAGLLEPGDDLVHLLGRRGSAHHDQQLGCSYDSHWRWEAYPAILAVNATDHRQLVVAVRAVARPSSRARSPRPPAGRSFRIVRSSR